MKFFYHIMFVACLGLSTLVSCTDGDSSSSVGTDSGRITLRFDIPGSGRAVEEINAVEAREDLLHSIDVFIYEVKQGNVPEAGSIPVHYERITPVTAGEYIPLDADKEDYMNGSYKIYVIANIPDNNPLPDPEQLTFEEFKNYKLEGTEGCNPYGDTENYYFLMDGSSASAVLSEDDGPVSVSLSRAAAKFEVTVKLGNTLSGNYTMGVAQAGWEQTPATVLLNQDGLLQDLTLTKTGLSSSPIETIEEGTDLEKRRLVLYTYPNSWKEGDINEETYIVLNLPLTYIGGEGQDVAQNYYKIKVGKDDDGDKLISRNTLYRINITVDIQGTTEWEDPTELEGGFSILPWGQEDINIDGGGSLNYLMLSEDEISFSNTEENMSVAYLSSSAIETVKVSDVYWINSQGVPTYYTESGALGRYFPDARAEDGYIHISSELPGNNAPKYFTVTVTNTQGNSEFFKVIQYPLEYITFEEGQYSTMEELWDYRYDSGTVTGTSSCTKSYTRNGRTQSYWNSKVSKGDHETYNYSWSRGKKNESRNRTFDNNRMYHVRITKTSDAHVIAVPEIDPSTGWTDSSEENNKKVSPSFMLASQLGALTNFLPRGNIETANDGKQYYQGYIDAAEHCKDYIEVKEDGTVYDDWRLPTLEELKIIAGYQYAPVSAGYPMGEDDRPIAPVLTDTSNGYWSATGTDILRPQQRTEPYYIVVSPEYSRQATIRCIRDVKPSDSKRN